MFYVQKKSFLLASCFLLLASSAGCTKVFRTATPSQPTLYKKSFAASPNDLYYALRWALRTYGYPIAEEDLQNGVIKSHYVPVKTYSHYLPLFNRQDFGVNAGYHQLECRLVPQNGTTEVQIGSKIQSMVARLRSRGTEEQMILQKVADYLRSQNVQVTNVGLRE